jgi:hypothetical protein
VSNERSMRVSCRYALVENINSGTVSYESYHFKRINGSDTELFLVKKTWPPMEICIKKGTDKTSISEKKIPPLTILISFRLFKMHVFYYVGSLILTVYSPH